MKILLVTSFKHPHKGGLSTHLNDLKVGLIAKGNQVDILQYSDFINKFTYILNEFKTGGNKYVNRTEYKIKRIKLHIMKHLKQKDYDLVHFHDSISASVELPNNIKRVFTMHGPLAGHSNENKLLDDFTNDYLLKIEKLSYKVNNLIAVDQGQKNIINLVYPNKEVEVINNSVSIKQENPILFKDRKNYFLLTRRLTEKNGVIYAVKAFIEWNNKSGVELLIAGDGPQKSAILEYLKDKINKDSVKFLGSLEHNKIIELVKEAKAIIVPSIPVGNVVEATSISVLESLAVGTPVISSKIGGLVDIDKNKNILYFIDPKNTKTLINKFEEVINNTGNNHYSLYQNHFYRYFSYEGWLLKHQEYYKKVVESKINNEN